MMHSTPKFLHQCNNLSDTKDTPSGSSNAESNPGMGFPENKPIMTAMVRDLYQILFLISGSGGCLCTFNSFCKNYNSKKIKDIAPVILISCAWVKTVLVPRTVRLCSADGHILS